MKHTLKLVGAITLLCLSQSASATWWHSWSWSGHGSSGSSTTTTPAPTPTYTHTATPGFEGLDFTQSTMDDLYDAGFEGTYNGIGFALTTVGGEFSEFTDYDGSDNPGCGSALECNKDGVGIVDDEVSAHQTLIITFDQKVEINGFHFLDLYHENGYKENVEISFIDSTVSLQDETTLSIVGIDTPGVGGYASLTGLSVLTDRIQFTAPKIWMGDGNDFALAALEVKTDTDLTAVPVPAAAWLFGSALFGFVGVRRAGKQA